MPNADCAMRNGLSLDQRSKCCFAFSCCFSRSDCRRLFDLSFSISIQRASSENRDVSMSSRSIGRDAMISAQSAAKVRSTRLAGRAAAALDEEAAAELDCAAAGLVEAAAAEPEGRAAAELDEPAAAGPHDDESGGSSASKSTPKATFAPPAGPEAEAEPSGSLLRPPPRLALLWERTRDVSFLRSAIRLGRTSMGVGDLALLFASGAAGGSASMKGGDPPMGTAV